MRNRKSIAFTALMVISLLATFLGTASASQTATWTSNQTTASINTALTGTYTSSLIAKWVFVDIAVNSSDSGNTFALNIKDTDSKSTGISIVPSSETYYLSLEDTDLTSGTIPASANWDVSNATYTVSINNNVVSYAINGVTLISNIHRTGTGNFTTISYVDDFTGRYFTAGYVSVTAYSNSMTSSLDSMVGVIIMVSVVSVLLGAVKLKKR